MKYIVVLLLASCAQQCYPEAEYGTYTHYSVLPTKISNIGLQVDDPLEEINLSRLDAITKEVVDCVSKLKPHWNPSAAAQCFGEPTFKLRDCLIVKVAPWHISPCTGEQVFECSVPFASCAQKGQSPDGGCPCSCRAMIQDNTTILVTPNLKLYPAYLTTLLTGCNYPWEEPLLECAKPR